MLPKNQVSFKRRRFLAARGIRPRSTKSERPYYRWATLMTFQKMYIIYTLGPQNHEKWRFYTPKIWVITPKKEGCGFPWYSYSKNPPRLPRRIVGITVCITTLNWKASKKCYSIPGIFEGVTKVWWHFWGSFFVGKKLGRRSVRSLHPTPKNHPTKSICSKWRFSQTLKCERSFPKASDGIYHAVVGGFNPSEQFLLVYLDQSLKWGF